MKKLVILGVAIVSIIIGAVILGNNNKTSAPGGGNAQVVESSQKSIVEGAVIYDVRTPEEFAEKRVRSAQNLPLDALKAGNLPSDAKDAPVYVYCRSGNRSAQATTLLKNAGFTNVTDMGGLEDAVATYNLDTATGQKPD